MSMMVVSDFIPVTDEAGNLTRLKRVTPMKRVGDFMQPGMSTYFTLDDELVMEQPDGTLRAISSKAVFRRLG
jgi:hypothetical protein